MEDDEEGQTQATPQNPNDGSSATLHIGKSCRGCLYFSSLHKSKSKPPTCVGFSETYYLAPEYFVHQMKASRESINFTDFKYACVGYSVFLEKKDSSSDDTQSKHAEFPLCSGFELLMDKKTEGQTQAPAHAQETERSGSIPQPRSSKPAHSAGEEYLNRFKRNAFMVACGVARNVNKACHQVKQILDDIYRQRPK